MGDHSKSTLYSMLLAYLEERGVDLSSGGSAERGLYRQDAIGFIELLSQNGVRPLGIEPWRKISGRYRIDSFGVWASNSEDPRACSSEAKRIIEGLCLGERDVITIQF
jgi:hypothetical protein